VARRSIREYDAKRLLATYLPEYLPSGFEYTGRVALVVPDTDWGQLIADRPWLRSERLVVKPDQLFGKRGKSGLLLLDTDLEGAKAFIQEKQGQELTIGKVTGILTHFLIEPFVPHRQEDELFVAIRSEREEDIIYFSLQGGIDVEENWDAVLQVPVPILADFDDVDLAARLPDFPRKEDVVSFIRALYRFYADLAFTYLEINPLVFADGSPVPLDFVARLDDTAAFECARKWGDLEFPPAFGTRLSPEEDYIRQLDEKSGASLKLTLLNPEGRVWALVAGGGASVIYADTIADLGFASEMANYGEYSGNPSKDETYEYTRTILDLMTRQKDPQGKVLLIGGGIANFTDVAKTFAGIVQALTDYQEQLRERDVKIYVRRGGPNYQEGLRLMRNLGEKIGVPIEVYGPELHMTEIVPMALDASTQAGGQK
jgi:ATP-citrate lyase beta-subunit